jgi:LmbE family N-acetylglucosaminyl deacetylase
MHTLTRIVLATLCCCAAVRAEDLGRVALVQALKDAACPLRLMCVAAHPDDEDGASLAFYRMKHGVKTFVVIATRGEGGQNEIGPELYNELGVIRTREMMNAARVEGSELHFLDRPEFGFSKSIEETFEKWGHDAALKRMLDLLQMLRPHVVITHHGLMKDHGHHQAIGQIIKEAVEQARDESGAPIVQRLYVRDFTASDGPYVMDLGELEPVRGVTYAQIAAQALEEHHSQGMKMFIDRYLSGRPKAVYFERVVNALEAATPALGDEYGPLFRGVKAAPRPPALVALAKRAAEGLSNAAVLEALAALSERDRAAAPAELARAAGIAAELRLKVTPSDTTVTRGQVANFALEFTDFGPADTGAGEFVFTGAAIVKEASRMRQDFAVQAGQTAGSCRVTVPDAAGLTMPHAEQLFADNVLFTPQFFARAEGKLNNGAPFSVEQPVYVDIAPPITVAFTGGPYFLNPGAQQREAAAQITLRNHTDGPARAALMLHVPVGWHVSPNVIETDFTEQDEERSLTVNIIAVESFEGRETVRATLDGSPHSAAVDVVSAAVALPKKARVGLVRSYDDTLEQALRKLGIAHGLIGAEDFAPASLAQYTTVIIDMRAYQYRPDLIANNAAIFDYARSGGNVIVMYQKTFDWRPAYAPLQLNIANNRVTREDAAMKLLVPDHPFFNTPNKITERDWEGWIQERGLYFAGDWAPEFTPLIECNDPGEKRARGRAPYGATAAKVPTPTARSPCTGSCASSTPAPCASSQTCWPGNRGDVRGRCPATAAE